MRTLQKLTQRLCLSALATLTFGSALAADPGATDAERENAQRVIDRLEKQHPGAVPLAVNVTARAATRGAANTSRGIRPCIT